MEGIFHTCLCDTLACLWMWIVCVYASKEMYVYLHVYIHVYVKMSVCVYTKIRVSLYAYEDIFVLVAARQ